MYCTGLDGPHPRANKLKRAKAIFEIYEIIEGCKLISENYNFQENFFVVSPSSLVSSSRII